MVGADLREMAPCYDATGITTMIAANLMFEMLQIRADAHAARRTKP